MVRLWKGLKEILPEHCLEQCLSDAKFEGVLLLINPSHKGRSSSGRKGHVSKVIQTLIRIFWIRNPKSLTTEPKFFHHEPSQVWLDRFFELLNSV